MFVSLEVGRGSLCPKNDLSDALSGAHRSVLPDPRPLRAAARRAGQEAADTPPPPAATSVTHRSPGPPISAGRPAPRGRGSAKGGAGRPKASSGSRTSLPPPQLLGPLPSPASRLTVAVGLLACAVLATIRGGGPGWLSHGGAELRWAGPGQAGLDRGSAEPPEWRRPAQRCEKGRGFSTPELPGSAHAHYVHVALPEAAALRQVGGTARLKGTGEGRDRSGRGRGPPRWGCRAGTPLAHGPCDVSGQPVTCQGREPACEIQGHWCSSVREIA